MQDLFFIIQLAHLETRTPYKYPLQKQPFRVVSQTIAQLMLTLKSSLAPFRRSLVNPWKSFNPTLHYNWTLNCVLVQNTEWRKPPLAVTSISHSSSALKICPCKCAIRKFSPIFDGNQWRQSCWTHLVDASIPWHSNIVFRLGGQVRERMRQRLLSSAKRPSVDPE